MTFPLPVDEEARLAALREHQILDTPGEQEYDDITFLAAQICGTPIASIALIDEDRSWPKSIIGFDVGNTPRKDAFCAHTIMYSSPMVVPDALLDERFANNPFVTSEPFIRFYAGAPLFTRENLALGTLCVIDRKPREITPQQLDGLQALARQVSLRLELRRASLMLQKANAELEDLSLHDDLTGLYNRRGFFLHAEQQLKLFRERKVGKGLWLMVADMDGLKKINDVHGHLEGSAGIKKIGGILRRTFRDSDILSRPAGDEFLALAINAQADIAEVLPARLTAKIDEYNAASGKPYRLDVSWGMISVDPESNDSLADLIKLADAAMYENKRAKKSAAG
ncbi:MAG TPA: diguanylate cyclase [Pyrinomonadaceae bacterium]|jgi:diguanylate cyclase (GGDEF)-like protein|nr:diguanylate cyclase [Pyrinomonadaceae bacterium]